MRTADNTENAIASPRFPTRRNSASASLDISDYIAKKVIASEEVLEVVLHLMLTKCIPILLYGLEACPMRKTDLGFCRRYKQIFMKLFKTGYIDLVKCCQSYFCFELSSVLHDRRARKLDIKYRNHSNVFFHMISHL